jgi:transposase
MTGKAKRAQYTLEFKLEAVRLVKAGQSMAAVAETLGVVEQTLYNWVKADREGKLAGAGTKLVSPDGTGAAACGGSAPEDGARYFKKCAAYFAKESM